MALQELKNIADRLYGGENIGLSVWHQIFTYKELQELWETCKLSGENVYGQAWDDEVYEVLAQYYNHFDKKEVK